jgi:hypothetical protein
MDIARGLWRWYDGWLLTNCTFLNTPSSPSNLQSMTQSKLLACFPSRIFEPPQDYPALFKLSCKPIILEGKQAKNSRRKASQNFALVPCCHFLLSSYHRPLISQDILLCFAVAQNSKRVFEQVTILNLDLTWFFFKI